MHFFLFIYFLADKGLLYICIYNCKHRRDHDILHKSPSYKAVGCLDRGRMVVGFITTYPISAYLY